MAHMKSGRSAQKNRTRESLLAATRDLIAEGETVTVQRAAEQAGISKATAYRYFSDPSLMVAEAGLALEVAAYEDIVRGLETPREKLQAISLYIFEFSCDHQRAFRHFLARNLDAQINTEDGPPRQRRGARRVQMFTAALADTDMSDEDRSLLVACLTSATGTEAMIALYDIACVDEETARNAVKTTCDCLLDRFLPREDA